MLSKLYTIFHSFGIIYLGEPYKKENLDVIVWRRDKNEWIKKTKKYAVDLILKRKKAGRLKTIIDKSKVEANEMFEEVYHLHYADLSIICGLKFLHTLLHNLKNTMLKLKECNVKISLFSNSGEILQSFIGNDNLIEESLFGTSIRDAMIINVSFNI